MLCTRGTGSEDESPGNGIRRHAEGRTSCKHESDKVPSATTISYVTPAVACKTKHSGPPPSFVSMISPAVGAAPGINRVVQLSWLWPCPPATAQHAARTPHESPRAWRREAPRRAMRGGLCAPRPFSAIEHSEHIISSWRVADCPSRSGWVAHCTAPQLSPR